jgi:hypothetical protein
MRNFTSGAAAGLLALALAACGGGAALTTGSSSGSSSGTSGGTTGGTTGGTATTYSMGNGSGGGFQSGVIALSSASVSAGGTTSLTVSVVDQTSTLYTQSTSVTFNSPCVAAGTAAIQPNATVTTTTGIATATYVAMGCSGSDDITASATVNGKTLTASGTVTVAQSAIGSIVFVSAKPTNIALKGTGDSSHPESSTLVFKVLDASGGPRSGATVSFSLNSAVGGITLTPSSATATSDVQGLAQIVVNAGTVATSVKVTAAVTSVTPNITTQSSQLTITTGIPTASNFSLAVGCHNIEGWDLDGIQTSVTARLADRFQNPAPDGTAVTFHSKGGKIDAQCTTATSATEGGVCAVNFTSQAFRPSDGRVPLLATAIGEESFVDANGNGAFDPGETFTDTAEPFEDDAETGVYASGDYFYDFNNNGVHDGPDGSFNGVLCNDPSRCNGPKSAGIGSRNLIILSGSVPSVDEIDGSGNVIAAHIPTGGGTVRLWVRDVNGNPMPGQTVVSATVTSNSPASYQLGAPNSFNVPCATTGINVKDSSTVYTFSVGATATGTGTFTLEVKTPSGRDTITQIPIG